MSRRKRGICSVAGCGLVTKGNGLCNKHRARWLRYGDPLKVVLPRRAYYCAVEGCKKVQHALSYCEMHYARLRRHGNTDAERAPSGAGYERPDGYRVIRKNGIMQYEHILLAEKALGRKLPPNAEVHHMNGKKNDNFTPFNLVICPDAAYHMLLHARARMLGYEPPKQPRRTRNEKWEIT